MSEFNGARSRFSIDFKSRLNVFFVCFRKVRTGRPLSRKVALERNALLWFCFMTFDTV